MKPYFLPILLLGIIFISGCTGQSSQTEQIQSTEKIREFEIVASRFSFEPSVITVNKGDIIKLRITSIDVMHGFAINEFNVNERLELGKTVNVEFVASKSGTFTFYCSIFCGSGHSSMRGQLIVS